IDGVAGGYVKASFAQQLFTRQIKIPSKKIAEKLNHKSAIPFRLYAKAFVNAGYVYNREPGNNTLSNKLLYTGGIGLDIVTLTDLVIKIEWSFNQLGQNGLYLHPRNNY
ncbi:MAG TPA: hypothetical protein VHK91_07750, partial [Flavisolibacter sp.]|nr:hypothetical protein [Flavisolibacter sp.]